MLVTLGDLVDDVVVRLSEPINVASDTASVISRRRGGSAANVASTAGILGQPVRFLGQVGDDAIGVTLVAELAADGVDTGFVHRSGATGTIVILVDADGERSMLTDRRSCLDFDEPEPGWLDGADALHVPLYSLVVGTIATTARTVIGWAHERGVAVSIDLSSTAVMHEVGLDDIRELLSDLRPTVVFANQEEAEVFGTERLSPDTLVVVKAGAGPATVRLATTDGSLGTTIDVPAIHDSAIRDTTAAGDAFAAGFLCFRDWRSDPAEACIRAHRAAHRVLTAPSR